MITIGLGGTQRVFGIFDTKIKLFLVLSVTLARRMKKKTVVNINGLGVVRTETREHGETRFRFFFFFFKDENYLKYKNLAHNVTSYKLTLNLQIKFN